MVRFLNIATVQYTVLVFTKYDKLDMEIIDIIIMTITIKLVKKNVNITQILQVITQIQLSFGFKNHCIFRCQY